MQGEVVLVVASPFYEHFIVISFALAVLDEEFGRIELVLGFVDTHLLHESDEGIERGCIFKDFFSQGKISPVEVDISDGKFY